MKFKLYEVPRKTYVVLLEDAVGPPESIPVKAEEVVLFDHMDGMYGYCTNQHRDVVYIPAWQEVEIVGKEEKDDD